MCVNFGIVTATKTHLCQNEPINQKSESEQPLTASSLDQQHQVVERSSRLVVEKDEHSSLSKKLGNE